MAIEPIRYAAIKAKMFAEAEGTRAKLFAEAEGKQKLQEALNKFDDNTTSAVCVLTR